MTSQLRGRPASHAPELLALGLLTLGLFVWLLWPFLTGASFPVGPDGPVYLWWSRIARVEGLSAVGERPGAPALALVLEGTLRLSVVQAIAAIEVAMAVAVGLASVALVRARTGTSGWLLAGILGGTFAVHLAAGYLANLAIVAAFLACCALLDQRRGRSSGLAALVLAGGGLAHPLFFLLAAVILFVAAATAWRSDRREAVRLTGTAVGGGAIVGLGLLTVSVGPSPLDVDTSKDAFLRRAGLTSELRSAYLDRFVHRWTRYVQWVSVPLPIVGFGEAAGTAGRILRAWLVVTAVGVGVALATGWLPADRFVTFGFAVPILAALGLVRLARLLERRRVVAVAVTGALTLAMLGGSAIAWNRQEPFLSEQEVRAVTTANGVVSELPVGVPLVFLVNEPDDTVSFLAARSGNVIRAGVPPTRIRDVVVVVPPLEGDAGVERRALERLTARARAAAEQAAGEPGVAFVLTPFDEVDRPDDAVVITPDAEGAAPVDPLEPSSAPGIVWASVASLTLLLIVGYGWARIGLDDRLTAAAASPAIGAAMLILLAVALDAVGLSLGGTTGAIAASAIAGGGGYLAWVVLERRVRPHPSPQVEQQPTE